MSLTSQWKAAPSRDRESITESILIDPQGNEPIRAELFGVEHLEEHARRLAAVCKLSPLTMTSSPLLKRFHENGTALERAHHSIRDDFDRVEGRGLDAEWLIDNYHVVDEVLREVKKDLPSGYDAELPKLADPPLDDFPRVYALALSLVAHTDGGLDELRIDRFVAAFQTVAPLLIGELWAVPTMLRLVLLENLRRLADLMLAGRAGRKRADEWGAAHLASTTAVVAEDVPHVDSPPFGELEGSFVGRLIELLRDQGPAGAVALDRLDGELERFGIDPNTLLVNEHRLQAANQLSIANAITSLRLLNVLDWNTFFEKASQVETILRTDPAGVYTKQDFATRDRTRRSVEKIARGAKVEEVEVARQAITRAEAAKNTGAALSREHVGYYLIDRGKDELKRSLKYRPKGWERLLDFTIAHPNFVYFGSIGALTALLLTLFGTVAPSVGALIGLIVVLLIPTSELVVGVVNHWVTLLMPPKVLPKLGFREGIAADCSTFVVMPSMLVRPESARVLLERLEIHYLANPDPQLRFALLTDFADAPTETRPEDDGYVQSAIEGVRALNQRYAVEGEEVFYLFHRKRLFNAAQGVWMGWERKRGKLTEFNRLLRGATDTSYTVVSGDLSKLPFIKYIITLDADTKLIRDTARQLVGTIAHALNQPVLDNAQGRVVEGFGVLQPRVSVHMSGAMGSWFSSIMAYSAGIDPYSVAVSDVYMDLFNGGSFTGKGIYDVDAFEGATGHTFPENRILSHDLIEGNYAHCGLVTDIELFDDFPPRYHAYARREHRWVRGDWQLLPWLAPRVPSPDGPRRNPLPFCERWKVFDNLRRSLVPPSVLLLLILGWTVLPGPGWLWTLVALAVPFLPVFQQTTGAIFGAIKSRSFGPIRGLFDGLPYTFVQTLLTLTCLANQAIIMVDAISRTLVRLFITHRDMLEWETAASTERRLGTGIGQFIKTMWPAATLGLVVTALVAGVNSANLAYAIPVTSLWFISPVVAFIVSRPRHRETVPLTSQEQRSLRRVARRTWRFFETFVGDADHWLPPDNFQEEGGDRIAHRTSPTNKGLLLLSTLTAHDLGYIGIRTLVDRLEKTMATLEALPKHKGHFYNWYHTLTLEVLPPAYVSTVDSGNLLGCLIALREGLKDKAREAVLGLSAAEGLRDTLGLATDVLHHAKGLGDTRAFLALEEKLTQLDRHLDEQPSDFAGWDAWLGTLEWESVDAIAKARSMELTDGSRLESVELWLRAFETEVRERRTELALFNTVGPLDKLATTNTIAAELIERLERLGERAEALADAMDFTFLFKEERQLYSIGANIVHDRLDPSCYDLLASESCLTSYLTVARGEVPRKHWFQLGRPFIRAAGSIGLLSWGGTMFEYLMPRLLLKSLPGTILAEMINTTVARQIEYGKHNNVPWGISESGFSAQYLDGDYQYQSFGVPGLGLKRGLARDLVIAPYATALATMVEPREALANFKRIDQEGGLGSYGFYEAIDYTGDRMPRGKKSIVVRSYMAHHQGMSLIAIANATLGDIMPRRFHQSTTVRSGELLLQERIAKDVPIVSADEIDGKPDVTPIETRAVATPPMSRRLSSPATAAPRTHLLSNTQYSVMVTNSGAGYSTCHGLDITRWREDITRDHWGQFHYIRDVHSGVYWSTGYQPTRKLPDEYEVLFSSDKAVFRRRDEGIETRMEVTVSPEGLAEIRRITLTNHSLAVREIEVTSYAEIVLASHNGDGMHPAFGKLFIETEWLGNAGALLCRRRPRQVEQPPLWALHVSASDMGAGAIEFETDRARFLGRGRTTAAPAALDPGVHLSGTTGAVLDPVASLRRKLRIEPGSSAMVAFTTAMANTREEAERLAGQYREAGAVARAFDLAWAHSQVEHRQRTWQPDQAVLFQRLAAHIIYSGSLPRSNHDVITADTPGQAGLWKLGISGDLPIVLVRLVEYEELTLVHQLLAAHSFLRRKCVPFDLVFLDERPAPYHDELHNAIVDIVKASHANELMDKPGGVFVRDKATVTDADCDLLQLVARVVLVGAHGPLAAQLDRVERARALPAPLSPTRPRIEPGIGDIDVPADLDFNNGLGGFASNGREYVIMLRGSTPNAPPSRNGKPRLEAAPRLALPPAPWINVIANPGFGFLISEYGSGSTWAGNSQSNRLTPWNNDPVSDQPGEVLYVRDEEGGEVWCPTPGPIPHPQPVVVRHGQGYSTFERSLFGIDQKLTVFAPIADPVKVVHLSLTNTGNAPRKLSATYYAEWVLGSRREQSAHFIHSELDSETGALLARNPYNTDVPGRVAFLDVNLRPRTYTADRGEFLGRNGSVVFPAALSRTELSNRVGGGFDPCGAVQAQLTVAPGATVEIVFVIGQSGSVEDAQKLIERYREPANAKAALDDVVAQWDGLLGAVQVKTPNRALDLMVNRWLLYQALACRIWGRSAFYQSGGAYGYRDQLQDVMALVYGDPAEARAHILRAAARQFVEGDAQHWWHPPLGRGVRTRFSDDYLWLPFVTAHYVRVTGDTSILDETVPFIEGPPLMFGQEDTYGLPTVSTKTGTIYEHGTIALERACGMLGKHGLPLMGSGDWNDGMNRVGIHGEGESVWVAWFLCSALARFAKLAEGRGDHARAAKFGESADELRKSTEENAWDGHWYLRAYFDDGTPLGSKSNEECKIDSIVQTWAVISGFGDPTRSLEAMGQVETQLVKDHEKLVLLFTPPFDTGSLQPGYIKGYVPGIRENGGQYTHAATWVGIATALLGQGDRAMALFDMLNPINHALSPEEVELYKVEPYVVVADIYGMPPHTGRGGWTWYTGSASWVYRLALENLLGFQLEGNQLTVKPCIPRGWPGFELTYRYRKSTYRIAVENPDGVETGVRSVSVNGNAVTGEAITLTDDGGSYEVRIVMGA